MLPQMIGRRHAHLPPPQPGEPGMYALGAPGLLERTLSDAGFRDVSVHAVPAPRSFASSDQMIRHMSESTMSLRETLSKLDEAGRTAMLAEIAGTMRQFEQADGSVVVPARYWSASARSSCPEASTGHGSPGPGDAFTRGAGAATPVEIRSAHRERLDGLALPGRRPVDLRGRELTLVLRVHPQHNPQITVLYNGNPDLAWAQSQPASDQEARDDHLLLLPWDMIHNGPGYYQHYAQASVFDETGNPITHSHPEAFWFQRQ